MKKFAIFFVLVSLMASPSFAFDKKDKKNKEQKEEKKKERPIAEQRAAKKKAKEEKKKGTANGSGSTAETTATIAVAPAPAPQSDIVMVKTLTTKKPKKETADLQNTYWRLSEMNGKTLEPGSDEAYVKLTEKKSVLEGNAGCNTIVGTFKVGRHDEIAFEFGTTKKMCADMSVESYMVNALKNANHYDINGHHLMLYNDSVLLAIFEAKYAD
jgi:heat shock protein HslJ